RFSRDWSSDVCSSDLDARREQNGDQEQNEPAGAPEYFQRKRSSGARPRFQAPLQASAHQAQRRAHGKQKNRRQNGRQAPGPERAAEQTVLDKIVYEHTLSPPGKTGGQQASGVPVAGAGGAGALGGLAGRSAVGVGAQAVVQRLQADAERI